MKLELASAPLRREHAAAMRRLVNTLIGRLVPFAYPGARPAQGTYRRAPYRNRTLGHAS